jgi:membrane protein
MKFHRSAFRTVIDVLRGQTQPLATSPRDFTFQDWKQALIATKDTVTNKRVGLLAAGIAYFATLAFFPLLAASVAIASFLVSDSSIHDVVKTLETYLPADVASLITTQLTNALHHESSSTLVAIVAILISLFSVSGATQNLINASNVAYERNESRGILKLRLVSFKLLFINLFFGAIVIILLLLNESILQAAGLPYVIAMPLSVLRWVLIAAIIGLMLAVFYRYGPDRKTPKWQWVTWGSIISTVIWLAGTGLFFVYASNFANFSKSYSLFAGIIALMLWFNLSAFIMLLGAGINHQLEMQSIRKKTE